MSRLLQLFSNKHLLKSGGRRLSVRFSHKLKYLIFVVAILVKGAAVAKEATKMISGQRVTLIDIIPHAPAGLAQIDLGQAPPPGRTRYFSYEEMASRLQAIGVSASRLKLPRGIRVESQARQFSSADLEKIVSVNVESALPPGIHLKSVEVGQAHVLSPDITAGNVRLPRFVTKDGPQVQTGTVEILWGKKVALRLPVRMKVVVDGADVGAVVKRGTSVTLVIRRGNVEIAALAKTLSTGRVGDTVSLKVGVTSKIMSARLVSSDRAEMELLK